MGATLQTNQVFCSQCEEAVHRYATRCPYCQHDIKPLQSAPQPQIQTQSQAQSQIQSQMQSQGGFIAPSASSKITPLSQPGFTKPEPLQAPDNDAEDESSASTANSFFSVLMPLVTLLGGTFFLFFALMLKLFSKNGKLTLEWSADSWPYFLFPALFLLLLGLGTITSEEPESI